MSNLPLHLILEKGAFPGPLLRWYGKNRRSLPWRRDRDPYRILVSEFMLQQTRVEAVVPYFDRFLRLFPTLPDLSRSPLPKVLRAWAGLGYYARARNLHAAAGIICRELKGKIPSTKEGLLKLPGFGPYTAGAVASLAFNHPVAAVDGNVKRILSRLLDLPKEALSKKQKNSLENFLADSIPPGRASDFNQALMDLGALICLPRQPRCPECPITDFCAWRGVENQAKEKGKKKVREEIWAIALLEEDGRFLLHKKIGNGLLAGLWQFPTVVLTKGGEAGKEEGIKKPGALREVLRKGLQERFGLKIKIKGPLPEKEHVFTHIHAALKPFLCSLGEVLPERKGSKEVRWVRPSGFSRYPISTAMRKIAALIPKPQR